MSLTESDKTVLTKYPPLPSKCVICLRDSNGEINFVDFQMSVDVYGAVVICVDCFLPVAQLMGFVDRKKLDDADEQIRNLVEINRELAENNAKLNTTIDSLLALRPGLVSSDLSSDASPSKSEGSDDLDFKLDFDI